MPGKRKNKYAFPKIRERLKILLPPKRFLHSIKASETAVTLAKKFNSNIKKAALAGLVHDCAKGFSPGDARKIIKKYRIKMDEIISKNPALRHSATGPYVAMEKLGIKDRVIFEAVREHTVGRKGMNKTAKIVYVADFAEPGRKYGASKRIRAMIKKRGTTLDELVFHVVSEKLIYLIKEEKLIHPNAINLWNSLVIHY